VRWPTVNHLERVGLGAQDLKIGRYDVPTLGLVAK